MKEIKKGEIIIYKDRLGPELVLKTDGETVWMTQAQIAQLFSTDRTSVGRHIRNILNSLELRENSVCAKIAHTATDGKVYQVQYYNLDVIISVGYRVNSKRATQFRVWATHKLKEYLIKGYIVNEQKLKEFQEKHNLQLKELQQTARLFQNVIESQKAAGYEKELLSIITDYANTWAVLNLYDKGELKVADVTKSKAASLDYGEAKKSIVKFKSRLGAKKEAGNLFGQEVSNKFAALLGNVSQTFGDKDLYPSIEEKAAHLLYFCIKDHPFADGNKRIGSLMFLLFLVQNNYLISKRGERKVNDTALAALALLIAESKPHDKDVMVKLVINLINRK